jgi:hypothetical protein
LSRVRILTLFTALIALTATLSACGGGGSDDPQSVVDEATLQGIESADLDLELDLDVQGKKGGPLAIEMSGPFQSEEDAELPEVAITATAKGKVDGEAVDFDAGFTLLDGNKAYIGYEGTEYAVDSTTFNFVKSMAKQQGGGDQSSELTVCQEAAAELKVSDFIEEVKGGESVDVGGTSTTKVSGDLNASGALDAFDELLEEPACREQLEAAGSAPSPAELDSARNTVGEAIKSAQVDLYVGDDDIVRRLVVKAVIEPADDSKSKGVEKVDLDLDLTLTGVNEEQTISAPSQTKPLSALFLKLGINPIELLGALNGQGAGGISGLLEGLDSLGGNR